jgi:hypothetical protein
MWLRLNPFDFRYITSGEEIAILNDYQGNIYKFENLGFTIIIGRFNASMI